MNERIREIRAPQISVDANRHSTHRHRIRPGKLARRLSGELLVRMLPRTAEVCNEKAEVDEGAETLSTDFSMT